MALPKDGQKNYTTYYFRAGLSLRQLLSTHNNWGTTAFGAQKYGFYLQFLLLIFILKK